MWYALYFCFAVCMYIHAFLRIFWLVFPDACMDDNYYTIEDHPWGKTYVIIRDLTISPLIVYFVTKGFDLFN